MIQPFCANCLLLYPQYFIGCIILPENISIEEFKWQQAQYEHYQKWFHLHQSQCLLVIWHSGQDWYNLSKQKVFSTACEEKENSPTSRRADIGGRLTAVQNNPAIGFFVFDLKKDNGTMNSKIEESYFFLSPLRETSFQSISTYPTLRSELIELSVT